MMCENMTTKRCFHLVQIGVPKVNYLQYLLELVVTLIHAVQFPELYRQLLRLPSSLIACQVFRVE